MNFTAAYLRVSSPRRLDRQSTDSQRHALASYAKLHGLRPRWFEDYASGRTARRNGLAELLAAVQQGDCSQILITDLSRLSRSVRDTLDLIRELTDKGCTLTCVSQGLTFDRSAMSTFMLQVFAALAELDSNIKSERIKNGLALARERGVRLGARPNQKRRQQARILRESGLTYQQVADKLNTSIQNAYYLVKKGIEQKKAV